MRREKRWSKGLACNLGVGYLISAGETTHIRIIDASTKINLKVVVFKEHSPTNEFRVTDFTSV